MADEITIPVGTPPDNAQPCDDNPVDTLFADILGPEYWVSNSGVSRRSWEILLLRKAMLDDHNWSLAECAERYGISRERVRQLEDEAVKKLLVWKKSEDQKREERRRRALELDMLCARSAHVFNELVCRETICGAAPCPAPVPASRHRTFTFAELRESVLELLDFEAMQFEF